MENNKKFNKLSIASLILILIGPFLLLLDKFNIYLPKEDYWFMYVIIISFIIGFIFAIISLCKINKYGVIGRVLAVLTILIFITLTFLVLNSLNPHGRPKSPNAAIKSQLASMKAQGELFYQSNKESYLGVCDATQANNGFGGVSGPGLFFEARKYSKEKIKCFSDKDSWVVSANLLYKDSPSVYYCADSSGESKEITNTQNDSIINSDTLCSQSISNTEKVTTCNKDSDCSCRRFNGADFLPGTAPGSCNLTTNICNTCYYR